MGNCCQIDATTKALDNKLSTEEKMEKNTAKILFLGAGGGGKSTIFKQLGSIYNGKYDILFDNELKKKVYIQITEQMQAALQIWGESIKNTDGNSKLNESIEIVQNHKELSTFPSTVSNAIQFIWENSMNLKESMYSMRFTHKILSETSVYFWNELDRIKQTDYVPNDCDLLHLTHHTTGIIQRWFTIQGKKFHIFDVGGQVSERKKWINCFDNVTAVLFVVSLSCYNQTMFEDVNKNCMNDSMEIFKDICNNGIFDKSDIILFFNKKDLFASKIKTIEITECPQFDDFLEYKDDRSNIIYYNDKNNYDQCTSYIKAKFNALNKSERVIYTHFTCAIEKDNIQNVFDDVKNIILRGETNKFM